MTPAPGGVGPPLLSICVPTYNRVRHVEALVHVLLAHALDDPRYDVELVVVENACLDDTRARLARFAHPRLTVIARDDHLDTAEENMIRSLDRLSGRYVWFLGDDEVFDALGFQRMYRLLEEDSHDCLIFNSPTISPTGAMIRRQPIPMNAPMLAAPMGTIIEAVGLMFTFAGVSNVVQRRAALSLERGLWWLGRSRIYSHVAWIAEAHAAGRVAFVNAPLVLYRQNDYSDGHWGRVAERHGVQDRFFWTLGLARLIGSLADHGVLSWAQAGRILEVGDDGRRYRLVDHLIHQVHAQLVLWAASPDPRQAFSASEMEELRLFCLRADPSLFDLVRLIEDEASLLQDGGGAAQAGRAFALRFAQLFAAREAGGLAANGFAGRLSGYDVFRRPSGWVAVDAASPQLQAEVLAQVDPEPLGCDVLVAETLEHLSERAAVARGLRWRETREARAAERGEQDDRSGIVPSGPAPLWRRGLRRLRRAWRGGSSPTR